MIKRIIKWIKITQINSEIKQIEAKMRRYEQYRSSEWTFEMDVNYAHFGVELFKLSEKLVKIKELV